MIQVAARFRGTRVPVDGGAGGSKTNADRLAPRILRSASPTTVMDLPTVMDPPTVLGCPTSHALTLELPWRSALRSGFWYKKKNSGF